MAKNELAEALQEAKKTIEEQNEVLERVGTGAKVQGTVVHIDGHNAIVIAGGDTLSVINPPKAKVAPGDVVWLHPESRQIVQSSKPVPYGESATISGVHDDYVEVSSQSGDFRVASKGQCKDLRRGDRVLIDQTRTVVLKVIQKAVEAKAEISQTTWDMIGGHVEAKQLLREAIEFPYLYPEIYAAYKKRPTNGVLLLGPPGCGKTLLAKAMATALDGAFLAVKGPEILDPYVGVAEAAVRNLFDQARLIKAKTGKSPVIFIDEAEAILSQRGKRHGVSGMEQTIVPAFLTEMDGLGTSSAVVVLSTNWPDMLDPAIVRDGRIDYKVEIKRPSAEEAHEIFHIHMAGLPVHPECAADGLVTFAVQHLYDEKVRARMPYSGAMIAGVVDKASAHAIRRDLANGKKHSGLSIEDMVWALTTTISQETLVR